MASANYSSVKKTKSLDLVLNSKLSLVARNKVWKTDQPSYWCEWLLNQLYWSTGSAQITDQTISVTLLNIDFWHKVFSSYYASDL